MQTKVLVSHDGYHRDVEAEAEVRRGDGASAFAKASADEGGGECVRVVGLKRSDMRRAPKIKVRASAFLVLLTFTGCIMGDPSYSIRIVNDMPDTLSIKAHHTIYFDSHRVHSQDLGGKWISFKVPPKTKVDCGMAIAGIEDEMPFTDIVLTKANGDSIVAHGDKEVLRLFAHDALGGLETPYVIRVK